MIIFDSPHYLWFLISIPLLIFSHFTLLKFNQYKALKFANFRALKRVTGSNLITHNYIILMLRVIILIAIVLSLSKPILFYKADVTSFDYVIAIDNSASMSAQDFLPNRLEIAKQTAKDFVDLVPPSSNVGVLSFSGATFIELPPDGNKIKIKEAIESIEIMSAGGTDIPGAIISGSNLLVNTRQGRAIILLTDGSNTIGTFIRDSVAEATLYANKKRVRIYTIGIGSEQGPIGYLPEYYNISAVYNQENLEIIANATEGVFFEVETERDFADAYASILENDKQGTVDLELSMGLIALALVLLFIEWGLINTRFKRFP